ncbi:MAG: CHAT domain-containing protein [Acidobacteriota bacterium]
MKTILFLGAEPVDASRARPGEELREIRALLDTEESQFRVVPATAARWRDMELEMHRHQPTIVHFCGHGVEGGGVVLENREGRGEIVSCDNLVRFFSAFAGRLELILLNACHTADLAEALSHHVSLAIGWPDYLKGEVGISYARSFYQGLKANLSYEEAHNLAAIAPACGLPSGALGPILAAKRRPRAAGVEVRGELEQKVTPWWSRVVLPLLLAMLLASLTRCAVRVQSVDEPILDAETTLGPDHFE